MSTANPAALESQIEQWRGHLRRRQAINPVDVSELEDHLREQIAALTEAGLTPDEAFLVAVKRMGAQDAIAGEFAREHSERLWKQLVAAPSQSAEPHSRAAASLWVALALAVAAAAAIKLPLLFGVRIDGGEDFDSFYARNISLFVLPLLALYFVWKRGAGAKFVGLLAAAFVVAAVAANLYPLVSAGDTLILQAIHLPVAIWLLVGVAYAGGRWREGAARMDFVRFSGELFIYYVLMALGGGVLIAFTVAMFTAIGIDPETFVGEWMVPCGAMGAVLVGAWLVEAKQSVIENMAPVLTRVFTPLFTVMLIAFLGTMLLSGRGVDVEREVLIGFDLLLVVVLGLLLYAVSARDPQAPRGPFDILLLALLVSALVADGVALAAMAGRINEFGFTANRTAALGLNLILLVNLAWSAWLQLRLLTGKGGFAALERWQTAYLPVFAAWGAFVALTFPPLFAFS